MSIEYAFDEMTADSALQEWRAHLDREPRDWPEWKRLRELVDGREWTVEEGYNGEGENNPAMFLVARSESEPSVTSKQIYPASFMDAMRGALEASPIPFARFVLPLLNLGRIEPMHAGGLAGGLAMSLLGAEGEVGAPEKLDDAVLRSEPSIIKHMELSDVKFPPVELFYFQANESGTQIWLGADERVYGFDVETTAFEPIGTAEAWCRFVLHHIAEGTRWFKDLETGHRASEAYGLRTINWY